jgi:hypothetical protein
MMMIKTAYQCFPLAFLKAWAAEEDKRTDDAGQSIPWGNHKVLRHFEPNPNGGAPLEFIALGHRDRKLKTIIATKGTTLPGEPMSVERSRIVLDDAGGAMNEYYLKTTTRCKMMEMLFDDFSVIDIENHRRQGDIENHRRQGVLRVEKFWLTKCWWKRCFATVGLGMCVVDAYLIYKCKFEEFNEDGDVMEFLDYAGKLAHSLIHNVFLEGTPVLRARGDTAIAHVPTQYHRLMPIGKAPLDNVVERHLNAGSRVRLRCSVCSKQTAWYCAACSSYVNTSDLKALCNPNDSASICYFNHA